jgi:TDG/mug DNA glycosylase family protein
VTELPKLPDVLAPGLNIVFCGTAAGTQSARKQAYYAGSGNCFWGILHETGLTPTRFAPGEFRQVLGCKLGLTDVCKASSGMDRELPAGAFEPDALREKMRKLRPRAIAFNGKTAARVALGLKSAAPVRYGAHHVRFADTAVWILPSTSGAANGAWDHEPWHALARWVAHPIHAETCHRPSTAPLRRC